MASSPHLLKQSGPSSEVASLSLTLVIEEYLHMYAEGRSHTARAKQIDCEKFIEFLKTHRRASSRAELTVADWDHAATQTFIDRLLKLGESPATVSRRLATLKHMGRVLSERMPGFIHPAREVKPPRMQIARPQHVSQDEITEIRERMQSTPTGKRPFSTIRNQTLLNLLLDTGLRADEIRCLTMAQLDDKLEWIRKVRTKGRRFRDVYITTEMRPALRTYLEARAQELARFFPKLSPSTNSRLPLFISSHGANPAQPHSFEVSPKSIWRIIRSCSVDTKLHPHLLRHTYAVDLLDTSRDIRLVAQALGHSDVRVTMRYTERGKEEVAAALEKSRKGKR
jgi:site-specific recombinase XerD